MCLFHQDIHDTNHILGLTARRTGTYRILPLCRCLVQIFSRSVTSLASPGWTLHHVGIAAPVITVRCNAVWPPPLPSVEVYAMGIKLWISCPVISLLLLIATILLRLLDHPFSACNERPARPKDGPQQPSLWRDINPNLSHNCRLLLISNQPESIYNGWSVDRHHVQEMAIVEDCHWVFTFLLVLSLIYILDIGMVNPASFGLNSVTCWCLPAFLTEMASIHICLKGSAW